MHVCTHIGVVTAVCGEEFVATSGIIISPGYPTAYDSNLDCNYSISVAANQFIVLAFRQPFFIEGQGRKVLSADAPADTNKSAIVLPSPRNNTSPGGKLRPTI